MRWFIPLASGASNGSCMLLLLASSAVAADAITAPKVVKTGPDVNVHFNVRTDAPALTCYSVISDFGHLARFVPSLDSSEVVSKPGEPLQIRQVGHARTGLFAYTLDVTLAI